MRQFHSDNQMCTLASKWEYWVKRTIETCWILYWLQIWTAYTISYEIHWWLPFRCACKQMLKLGYSQTQQFYLGLSETEIFSVDFGLW
jgi:hypothetical protein